MANLEDVIVDHYPPVSGLDIPLSSPITITFDRLMDEDELEDHVFVEGPDTDQYIGPGLFELRDPDNVSQGDLDDFLRSPGYQGIVEGTFTFEEVDGGTKLTFTPTLPFATDTSYTVHLLETIDTDDNTVSGHVTWPFESGTGSITELPTNISTSVLAGAIVTGNIATGLPIASLEIVSISPADHSVENTPYWNEILVEFNGPIDPDSVTSGVVLIDTIPASDHPSLSIIANEDIQSTLEVSGNFLKIKLYD